MSRCSKGPWVYGWFVAVATSVIAVLGACSSREVEQERDAGPAVGDGFADWAVHESELGLRGAHPKPRVTYYRLRRSTKPCDGQAPCGGYTVEALPKRPLRCADGAIATACHVVTLRAPSSQPDGVEFVARGRLGVEEDPVYGTVGVLDAEVVWSTLDYVPDSAADNAYFLVSKPARVCTREPCPVARVQRVGTPRARAVLELDFQTECPDIREIEALRLMATGELLVHGKLGRKGPFGAERLVVSALLFTELPTYCPPADTGVPQITCNSDPDCGLYAWCRDTEIGGRQCMPYKLEGEQCFWSPDEPWREQRCQLGEQWCTPGASEANPGICRTACRGTCNGGEWCSYMGCMPTGTCTAPTDCMRTDNPWEHEACAGFPTCDAVPDGDSQCSWHCGNPACVELSGTPLWGCDEFLGFGVLDGACAPVTGCRAAFATDFALFDSVEACQAACDVVMP